MHVAYLFACGLGAIVWLVIFVGRPDLRRVMASMSLAGLPLALSDLFYVPQYWRPQTLGNLPVGFEGFIFSAEAAGICAVIYAATTGRTLSPPLSRLSPSALLSWIRVETDRRGAVQGSAEAARRLGPVLLPLPISAVTAAGLHTNLEWGLYLGLIAAIAATVMLRQDLAAPAFIGGLAFLPVYTIALLIWITVFPSVHSWFTLWRMPRVYLLGVPVTEIVFGALFASYWTGVYPLVFGRRFVCPTRMLSRRQRLWSNART